MAFTFNSDEEDDNAQPKTNIFAPEGGQQQTQPQAGAAAPKTSISSAGGGGSGGGGAQQSAAPQAPITPGDRAKAYRNLQATIPTAGVEKTKGQISSADQKLQDQANAYTAGSQEAAKGYALSDDDLKGAAQGNQGATERVTKGLSTGSAPVYQAYEGLSDKDRPDVSAYQNADTFTDLIRQSVGPQYSPGASRLDAMLLRRDPNFRNTQAEVQGSAKALQEKSDKQEEELTKAARDQQDAALKEAQGSARTRLGDMGKGIVSAAKQREIDEEAKRGSLDLSKIGAEKYKSLEDIIRQDLGANDPRSVDARSLEYLNSLDPAFLSKYVNVDKDVDWRELLSEGDVGQYNRISGLLGQGDSLAYVPGGAGDPYSFDQGGALADIKGRIGDQRRSKDQADASEIERIIAENQAEADAATKSRDSRYGWDDFKNYIGPDYNQAAIDELSSRTEHGDKDLARILTQPVNTNPLTWQDLLTGDEASSLNSLYQDSGELMPEIKAGAGQGSRYDVDALKRYYDEIVNRKPAASPVPRSGGNASPQVQRR